MNGSGLPVSVSIQNRFHVFQAKGQMVDEVDQVHENTVDVKLIILDETRIGSVSLKMSGANFFQLRTIQSDADTFPSLQPRDHRPPVSGPC